MGSIVMQKISNSKFLTRFITLLVTLLSAKLVAVGIDWFLPKQGLESQNKRSYVIAYRHIDFHNMLKTKVVQVQPKKSVSQVESINTLVLKGLYGNDSYGYAIVAKKSAPKNTTIVAIGESYASYKLKRIALDHIVFSRNNKEYILHLGKDTHAKNKRFNFVESSDESDAHTLSRRDIQYYSKNIDHLDHDIAVDEVYENGKINGFKIRNIRKGSKIAQIGLKRGDIILKANNIALKSYNDAFKIYQNLSKLKTIDLLIKRANQEKEILYEIH